MKNIRVFYLKIFSFGMVKFSIYLNRGVFVLTAVWEAYSVYPDQSQQNAVFSAAYNLGTHCLRLTVQIPRVNTINKQIYERKVKKDLSVKGSDAVFAVWSVPSQSIFPPPICFTVTRDTLSGYRRPDETARIDRLIWLSLSTWMSKLTISHDADCAMWYLAQAAMQGGGCGTILAFAASSQFTGRVPWAFFFFAKKKKKNNPEL